LCSTRSFAGEEAIARVFRDDYDVKLIQPGTLRGRIQFRDVHILQHDCAPFGHSAGVCLIDLETHRVLSPHVSGRYRESSTAVPLWMLHDDPLLCCCEVTFGNASCQELQAATGQVERLARSRHWSETKARLDSLYQRAFDIGAQGSAQRN
jgi:hypothetical protein